MNRYPNANCVGFDNTINRKQTTLGVLLEIEGKKLWFSRAQLEDYPDEGETGETIMEEWLALEKGVI